MKKAIVVFLVLLSTIAICTEPQQHCKGLKKDGTQCKSTIINKKGYCRFHDPDVKHCAFMKKSGERCKMPVSDTATYCRFHKQG